MKLTYFYFLIRVVPFSLLVLFAPSLLFCRQVLLRFVCLISPLKSQLSVNIFFPIYFYVYFISSLLASFVLPLTP